MSEREPAGSRSGYGLHCFTLALTNWTRILRIPRRPRESVDLPSPYAPSDIIEAINPRKRAAAVLREIEQQYKPKRQYGWEDYLDKIISVFSIPLRRLFVLNYTLVHSSLSVCLRVPSEPHFFEQYRTLLVRESRVVHSPPSPLSFGDLVWPVFGQAKGPMIYC